MDLLILLLKGFLITLQITVGAWLFAWVLGLLFSLLKETQSKVLHTAVESYSIVVRAIPYLVFLYIFYFGLGANGIQMSGTVAAIIGLGLAESSLAIEYIRGAIVRIPHGQRLAGTSLGFGRIASFRFVLIPQIIPLLSPGLLNTFVSLLKYSTLASAISAPEILYEGRHEMMATGDYLLITSMVIAIFFVVTFPLIRLGGRLENRARAMANGR